MKIYTKTGDAGETGLLGGARVAKNDLRIEALGSIDELNAALGVVRALTSGWELDEDLERVQCRLFDLGAYLASPAEGRYADLGWAEAEIAWLEGSIDAMESSLEPLRQFILPAGAPASSSLHLARAICRRAERALLDLHTASGLAPDALRYVNRLSDWLFVAARTANAISGCPDVVWSNRGGGS
jgi:cob(I)alamin adenosyltransferase